MAGNSDRASILFEIVDNLTPGLSQIKMNLRDVVVVATAIKVAFELVEQTARAVAQSMKHMVEEARQAEEASLRLSVVLRNAGDSAGYTKAQIDDMADAMAESTQFDDESIRNAASEILKFGTIHGETFKEALKLSADVAAFMGTDVVSAARDVAKAMADPETAAKLLKSAGVVLTAQQKDQLKAMGDVGDIAGQQKIILDRLKDAYAGMAEEINTGLTRATTGAKKAWDELFETLGKTAPVQATVKSSLGFIEQSLKDVKSIIEDGDWVEKLLAVVAFTGGMRGMKLTKQDAGGLRPGEVGGAIGGLPVQKPGETDAEYLARKKREKEAAEQAVRTAARTADDVYANNVAAAKEMQGLKDDQARLDQARDDMVYANAVEGAKELTKLTEDRAKAAAKIWDETRTPAERAVASIKEANLLLGEGAISWDTYGRAVDKAMEGLKDKTKTDFEQMLDAVKGWGTGFSRELAGMVVNADFSARRIGDAFKRLASEILAKQYDKAITQPVMTAGGLFFERLFGGSQDYYNNPTAGEYQTGGVAADTWTSGADLPGLASGGSFQVGGVGGVDSQLVAFRASPDETVSVTRPGQDQGAINITQHMTFGSDVSRATLMQWGQTVKNQTVAAIVDLRRRNPQVFA